MGKVKSYLLSVTAISINSIAQNKTIVPKSGTVVFAYKASILDQQLYNNSKKAFSENL
jgi:hypothetical protein